MIRIFDQKAYAAQYYKELHQYCIEKGICTRCHKHMALQGRRLCAECTYVNTINRIRRAKNEKPNNDAERAEKNEKRRELYAKRKAEGICINCGQKKALANRVLCNECRIRANKASKKCMRKKRELQPPKPRSTYIPKPCNGENHPWKKDNHILFLKMTRKWK